MTKNKKTKSFFWVKNKAIFTQNKKNHKLKRFII